jgi:hypothetical protein
MDNDKPFTIIDEQTRRKLVIDYISMHLGCTAEDVVRSLGKTFSGQTKGLDKITIGREKIFKILKYLKKENAVIEKPDKSNRKNKCLYINNEHPLVFVPNELEKFEGNLKRLVDEAKKTTEAKYQSTLHDALLAVQEKEKEHISCSSLAALSYFSSSASTRKTEVSYDFAAINAYPFYLLYSAIEVNLLHSSTLWPTVIKNDEALKELYVYVFKKFSVMLDYINKNLNSIRIQISNDIISSFITTKLYMTNRLKRCVDAYAKLNMEKVVEPVIGSLWKIQKYGSTEQGGLLPYIYPEPKIYKWPFSYGSGPESDDWRRLLYLQKQHPEETYENYLSNTFKIQNNQHNSPKSRVAIVRQTEMKSKKIKHNKKRVNATTQRKR